jgi:xylulokinase
MDLLLGLDVGTTATKALLFDLGRMGSQPTVVAAATHPYGLLTPREGWVEQDPEALWQGVVATSRAVMERVGPGDRVVALSQSSQAGTTIPVDAEGTPTYNAISWMDQRAAVQARQVEGRWGAAFVHTTTGWPLIDGLPLQHIAWLRQDRPTAFAATRHLAFVNDFIVQRLTGHWCMNPSDASITQLMNVATGDWDQRLLDTAGIARDQLSPIRPSGYAVGTLTAAASEATGLPRDVLVVNGAHDQYCAAVGSGVTRPGRALLSCGTAWVVLAVPESLEKGLCSGMAVSCHAIAGRWGAIRSLGGVGASLEWFLDNVWKEQEGAGKREKAYQAVNQGVARSPAGANGLLFYPLAGGHATIGPGRGGLVGLSLSHSRDDMARAVMEGIAFELRWAMEEMRARGIDVAAWVMVGGAAESPAWPQIVADVTGVPVALPALKQAAGYGAAILAGVGAGLFADPEAGLAALSVGATLRGRPEMLLQPVPQNREGYEGLFATYQELGRLLIILSKNADR